MAAQVERKTSQQGSLASHAMEPLQGSSISRPGSIETSTRKSAAAASSRKTETSHSAEARRLIDTLQLLHQARGNPCGRIQEELAREIAEVTLGWARQSRDLGSCLEISPLINHLVHQASMTGHALQVLHGMERAITPAFIEALIKALRPTEDLQVSSVGRTISLCFELAATTIAAESCSPDSHEDKDRFHQRSEELYSAIGSTALEWASLSERERARATALFTRAIKLGQELSLQDYDTERASLAEQLALPLPSRAQIQQDHTEEQVAKSLLRLTRLVEERFPIPRVRHARCPKVDQPFRQSAWELFNDLLEDTRQSILAGESGSCNY